MQQFVRPPWRRAHGGSSEVEYRCVARARARLVSYGSPPVGGEVDGVNSDVFLHAGRARRVAHHGEAHRRTRTAAISYRSRTHAPPQGETRRVPTMLCHSEHGAHKRETRASLRPQCPPQCLASGARWQDGLCQHALRLRAVAHKTCGMARGQQTHAHCAKTDFYCLLLAHDGAPGVAHVRHGLRVAPARDHAVRVSAADVRDLARTV